MRGMTKQLSFDRAQRIADQIHSIVSMACLTQISDKRLDGVQITYVKATKDLRLIRINFYVDESTPEKIRLVLKGFRSASGFLKQAIGQEVELKFMPELEFFFDEGMAHQMKMAKIMDGLNHASASPGAANNEETEA